MKNKLLKIGVLPFIIILLTIIYGCPGATPKITLEVTDCAKDDITIVDSSKVSVNGAARQWTLVADITVLCNGQVVNNADLKVEFWWPNGTIQRSTNEKGKITYRKNGQGGRPSGEKFTVTIKGNDGEKEQEFTIP